MIDGMTALVVVLLLVALALLWPAKYDPAIWFKEWLNRTRPTPQLIVMRLADMVVVHPDQIEAQCSKCGETVAVYPSGQEVMRRFPDVELICQVCKTPGEGARLAPGAEHEPFQSKRKQ